MNDAIPAERRESEGARRAPSGKEHFPLPRTGGGEGVGTPGRPHSLPGEPPGADFRAEAHAIVDHMADYLETLPSRPILRHPIQPGEVLRALGAAPETGERLDRLLQEVREHVEPGLMHYGHPAFLAYFGSSTTPPGIYGEMLAAAYNVSAMLWKTSPAATEMEMLVLDWLRQWLGLPASFEAVVYDTASVSSLHALAAAREALGLDVRGQGLAGRGDLPPLRVYVSTETHSSIEKAAIALGLGLRSIRKVPTDADFRLDPARLEAAICADLAAGDRPLAVVATVGTTSTTSVDPVPAIAEICARYGVWLHVDAAYGGALGLLPEARHLLDGCERADSLVVNGHKWLLVPLDYSILYTRHLDVLKAAFALTPEYLEADAVDGMRNYMDYGVQLGRRFRSLKAWMVFRSLGREGIAAAIREQMRLARLFAGWVDASSLFVRMAPVPMAVVCFRAEPPRLRDDPPALDAFNAALLVRLNETGRAYLSQTRLNGRVALRLAVGNVRTTEADLRTAWDLLNACTAEALTEPRSPGCPWTAASPP